MRDVNNGWLIRYLHSNTASAFFFIVYLHIGRGLYYGSYKAPRTLVWTIGTIIFILMMAIKKTWPNWMLTSHVDKASIYKLESAAETSIPFFSKARTRAVRRIGPHNKDVLDVLICGMLGDWSAEKIPGQISPSIRFSMDQAIRNSAYLHHLTLYFYEQGYCSSIVPKLLTRPGRDNRLDNRYDYRLTLFTHTSFAWIYDSFYLDIDGVKTKVVPSWIGDYLTPRGLAHLMQDGSRQMGQGISLATNCFTHTDCMRLRDILSDKFNFRCTVVKAGAPNQWRISIWKESMPDLVAAVKPYMVDEMKYKLLGYI